MNLCPGLLIANDVSCVRLNRPAVDHVFRHSGRVVEVDAGQVGLGSKLVPACDVEFAVGSTWLTTNNVDNFARNGTMIVNFKFELRLKRELMLLTITGFRVQGPFQKYT